jgi:ribosomal protein L29
MAEKLKKTSPKNDKAVTVSHENLLKKVQDMRLEVITLKRNMLSGDVQNVRAYKYKRRELARILTSINQHKVVEEK